MNDRELINEKWKNDADYRKTVVRRLEQKGTITKLDKQTFGVIVFNK